MMRQSSRVMENLAHIRDVIVAQQAAVSEHRARMARGSHVNEEYADIPDEYKGGGFAGGDAKKRRGVSIISSPLLGTSNFSAESSSSWTMPQLQ